MDGTPATVKDGPLIALRRIRVKDFRRIEQLDVEFPANVRVICFVGPNGSGKSSLLSKLAFSLCQYTHERAPDLPKGVGANASGEGLVRNSLMGEIRTGQPAYLVRTDWEFKGSAAAHTDSAWNDQDQKPARDFFPEDVGSRYLSSMVRFLNHWQPRDPVDDVVARSILLIRPADRCEQASYEEADPLIVTPPFSNYWVQQRSLPIRVKKWGFELEQFLYSLVVEDILDRPLPTKGMALFARIYTALIGETFKINVRPWPYVRLGLSALPELSALSAGELDVLVTAGLIIGQAIFIAMNSDRIDLDPQGFVFIDEIDSHLHPQWQQKVIPILTNAFPNVTFVITTHSPFVLRSLSKENSRVVRLPDGEVFNTEFNAWQIDDILGAVFEVPTPWSPGISRQLENLEALLKDPTREEEAIRLYQELTSHQSTGLKAECRRLAGLFGTAGFMEKLVNSANGSAANEEGSLASTAEIPT